MATYHPAAFPRKPNPKYANVFSELHYQAQLVYYRYEINTGMYVMSPAEKFAYNIVVLSFLVLLLSAIYYCLPYTINLSRHRLAYYFMGTSKLEVARMARASQEVLRSNGGEAVRSMVGGGKIVNASGGMLS